MKDFTPIEIERFPQLAFMEKLQVRLDGDLWAALQRFRNNQKSKISKFKRIGRLNTQIVQSEQQLSQKEVEISQMKAQLNATTEAFKCLVPLPPASMVSSKGQKKT